MRIIAISDTHSYHRKVDVPDGDVLAHCGDITGHGELDVLEDFAAWLKELPHKHKCVVFGNHDLFERNYKTEIARRIIEDSGAILLESKSAEIEGVKFYGDFHTCRFFNWAYNVNRGAEIAKVWAKIPDDTDVLILHQPPYGILDLASSGFMQYENVGCQDLLRRVKELKRLRLAVYGHLHHCGNQQMEIDGVIFANAAICTDDYKPTNKPTIIDL